MIANDLSLESGVGDMVASVGIGGSYDWHHAAGSTTSLFTEISALRGIGDDTLTGLAGSAGLRVSW